ncbi:MAG: hypothetical protein IH945_10400 [Armatimonadetes bacterium]|nr:hypothetical protein [Armatimonadota bacterium]
MATKALTILATAVAAAAVGCSGLSERDVIGKWERRVGVTVEDEASGAAQVAVAQMARAMTIELYLRDDGTCTAWENGISSKGTWALKDRQITLTFEQGGRLQFGDGKPLTLTVSEDGESMESSTSMTDTSIGYVFKKTI